MFERFTDRARSVVILAQEEAKNLNHNWIGTEHVLLGLIRESESIAALALRSLGISLDDVRDQIVDIIGQGQQEPVGHIPFTPRAKKVLELALREALRLGHNYIGTEHILLGIVREGEGVAAQILVKLGVSPGRVRQQVLTELSAMMPEVLPETVYVPVSPVLPALPDPARITVTVVPTFNAAAEPDKRLRKLMRRYNRTLMSLAVIGRGIQRLADNDER